MLRRVFAGMLLLLSCLPLPTDAQEAPTELSAEDRVGLVLKIGDRPERAIRGVYDSPWSPPGDQKVEASLDRIVTLRCREVSLGEVAREIERQLEIPVRLFREDRPDDGADPTQKVTAEAEGVPLASVLETLCSPGLLNVFAEHGRLIVVPSERSNKVRQIRIYPVARLQKLGMSRLITLVQAATSGPWGDIEPGGGTIDSYGNALVVDQTLRNHREIETFLDLLTRVYARTNPGLDVSTEPTNPGSRNLSTVESPKRPSAGTESSTRPAIELLVSDSPPNAIRGVGEMTPGDWKVETALRRIVTLRCQEVSLEDLALEIEQKFDIPVRFQRGDPPDHGVDPKQKVSIESYDVPLYRAITCIGPDRVRTYVAGGTLLFVPFGNGCDFGTTTRIYSVAPFRRVGLIRLSDLIVQATSGPWDDDLPGTGSISSLGDTFVIGQTPEGHREIDSLLNLVERLDIQPVPGEESWVRPDRGPPGEEVATGTMVEAIPRPRGGRPAPENLTFSAPPDGELPLTAFARRAEAKTRFPTPSGVRLEVANRSSRRVRGTGDIAPEDAKIEFALAKIVNLRCEIAPLQELANAIERGLGIPVELQSGRPTASAVDPMERISAEQYGVPLSQAIDHLGKKVRFEVSGGKLLFVPSTVERDALWPTRVYSVANFRAFELERLRDLITERTSGPWDQDEPGTGTLRIIGDTFVVRQTHRVHREIEDWLEVVDRIDIRPVPKHEQLLKPPPKYWGGFGEGAFGDGALGDGGNFF